MFRNIFTVFGVVAVFAVFFFFIRPDWIKQMASSPSAPGQAMVTKVNARLAAERILAREAPRGNDSYMHFDPLPNGEDAYPKIIEDVGDNLPSRNTSYMLIVNKSNNSMRYCRLSSNVKKVTLRGNVPSEVKINENTSDSGGPYQVVIWLSSAVDLQMEFELVMTLSARS